MADLPTIEMYPHQLQALPDYSMTLPSGVVVGKMWRRDCNVFRGHLGPDWIVGRYVPSTDPERVSVEWLRPVWPGGWDAEEATFAADVRRIAKLTAHEGDAT